MKAPSYQKRLMLLEEILSDGVKLFKMLSESEDELRRQLTTGDHLALAAAEKKRVLISNQVTRLEEKRKALIPEGTGVRHYIKTTIGKSSQPRLLAQLEQIIKELQQSRVLNEVNRSLLQERLRFSQDLRASLELSELTYDRKGKLKDDDDQPIKNLDRSV